MRKCVVYGLKDPRTGKIRYVGSTLSSRKNRRVYEHVNRAVTGRADYYSARWLRSLLSAGLNPVVVVFEECSEADRDARESFWINKLFEAGESLTNHTRSGRVTGYVFTDEDKAKLSASLRGKPKSEEHRKKLSLARAGKPTSQAHKQACRDRCLGRKMPQESVAKTAAAHRGMKRADSTKQKMRESLQHRRFYKEWDALIAGGKTCTKCSVFKPFDEYYDDAAMADNKMSACKRCRNAARITSRRRGQQKKPSHR